MKSLVIGFIALLLFQEAISQATISNKQEVNIKSPEVSAMMKFIEQPVDISTGIPKIDMPVYTIQTGKLTVPISLSYHAGGIKLSERSSVTGLGWSLNAGGVVSHIVKDKTDGSSDFSQILQVDEYGSPTYGNYYRTVDDLGNDVPFGLLLEYWQTQDKEPDVYNVAAPGLSGVFGLDNSNQFVHYTLDTFLIVSGPSNPGTAERLVIKNKQGVTYIFGKNFNNLGYKDTTSTSSGGPASQYSYNWYLSHMISADNSDTISFEYIKRNVSHVQATGVTYSFQTDLLHPAANVDPETMDPSWGQVSQSVLGECYVSQIKFKGGKVSFEYQFDRLDSRFQQEPRLSKINIRDVNDTLIQSCDLLNAEYYRRSGGSKIGMSWNGQFEEFEKWSLKLTGLRMNEFSGSPQYYSFTYDTAVSLPGVGAASQDFWGYYNGRSGNFQVPTHLVDGSGRPRITGTEREADINYMKAGILKEIHYPTGGFTQFEFESNKYITNEVISSQIVNSKSLTTTAMNGSVCADIGGTTLPSSSVSQTYIVSDTIAVSNQMASINVIFSGFAQQGTAPMTCTIIKDNVSILSETHNPSTNYKTISMQVPVAKGTEFIVNLNTNGAQNGLAGSGPCGSPLISVVISYQYVTTSSQSVPPKQAGGLRIKSIKNYSDASSLAMEKRYEYSIPDSANGQGVGFILIDPYYKNISISDYLGNVTGGGGNRELTSTINISTNTNIELGLNGGIPVYYPRVTEYEYSAGGTNGKTEHYFDRPKGYRVYLPGPYYRYDQMIYFPSWLSKPSAREIRQYESTGSGYSLAKRVENSYSLIEKDDIRVLKVIGLGPSNTHYIASPAGYYLGGNPNKLWANNLFLPRAKQVLTQTKEVMYANSDSISQTQSLFYNIFGDLSKTVSTNSKGDELATHYTYTGDLGAGPFQTKGIYSIPMLIESVLNNNRVVGGTFNILDDDANVSEIFNFDVTKTKTRTITVSQSTPPADYLSGVKYLYVPGSKNLAHVNKRGSTQSYIWDYQNSLPVAVVANAMADEIAYTSFEADGRGNWNNFSGIITTNTGSARPPTGKRYYNLTTSSTLSKSVTNGKSYIISYWRDNSSPFSISGGTSSVKTGSTINGWTYHEHLVNANSSTLTITGNGGIDEVRLFPSSSQMVTYTYNPLIGITCQADVNSRISYYEYDANNRLHLIRDQNGNVVKKYCYNYAGQIEDCGVITYLSAPKSGTFSRNNCSAGYSGGNVVYSVAAGEYTSIISQADADQKAQDDVNANGQAYANANGTCTQVIYARLTYENYNYSYSNAVHADVVVRFYSDAACTIPLSVSNLTIQLSTEGFDGSNTFSYDYPETVSGYSFMVEASAELSYDDGMSYRFKDYYLSAGAGYTVVW